MLQEVTVLGCSGAIARGRRTTAFRLGERVLIDAGTGVGDLSLADLAAIDHVFLTHAHLDHIAALPLLLDAVGSLRTQPLVVHALPETLQALQDHIFNGVIWPDFSRIPSPEQPYLRYSPLQIGQLVRVHDLCIEVLPASHVVPTVGYSVATPCGDWVFTGDTDGQAPAFWAALRGRPIAMLVIETAFANDETWLARLSQHLSPTTLQEQVSAALAQGQIAPSVVLGITHAKPAAREQIREQVAALNLPVQVQWLEEGQVLRFEPTPD